jgi:MFS family permease
MQNRPTELVQTAAFDRTAQGATVEPLDRRMVVPALMLVMVLASMEQTITATAMPTIIGELHGLEHYAWVASIYLLACTVTMPLYGRLADAWGRKKVILAAIAIFCVASLAAARAQSMGQLILFRGLQGLGAGGIMPVVLTIIGDLFTVEERARIQGFFSAVWGTSALAGPALGAMLVNTLGWRWIFFINLPLGVVAMGMLVWKYHDRERPHSTALDVPGAILLTIACTGLLATVSTLSTGSLTVAWTTGILATAGLAGGLFVWHEGRTPSPLLPPSLVLRRDILPQLIGSVLFGVAFLSLDVYVPLYVQGVRGGGAAAAASVVTPVMLTWAASSLFAAPLIVRAGFRRTAIVGAIIVTVSFVALLACAAIGAPSWAITCVLAVTGMGFGPVSMAMIIAAQDAVTWQQRGTVTAAISFFRTIGGAVGIGVLGGMLNLVIRDDLARVQSSGVLPAQILDPHARESIPPEILAGARDAIAHGLLYVFATMLAAAAMLVVVGLFIPNRKAKPMSKTESLEVAMG